MRPKRNAVCHPDRPHCADGLCKSCYYARARARKEGVEWDGRLKRPGHRLNRMAECHPDRPHSAHGLCSACAHAARYAEAMKNDPQYRQMRRDRSFVARHGRQALEKRQQLFAQQKGACAICGRIDRSLDYDHDHVTGDSRGLLCNRCNRGLGFFDDNSHQLLKAYHYLEGGK